MAEFMACRCSCSMLHQVTELSIRWYSGISGQILLRRGVGGGDKQCWRQKSDQLNAALFVLRLGSRRNEAGAGRTSSKDATSNNNNREGKKRKKKTKREREKKKKNAKHANERTIARCVCWRYRLSGSFGCSIMSLLTLSLLYYLSFFFFLEICRYIEFNVDIYIYIYIYIGTS